jgi:hypothetical protein
LKVGNELCEGVKWEWQWMADACSSGVGAREGGEGREGEEEQRATNECSAFRIPARCVAEYGDAPDRDSTW